MALLKLSLFIKGYSLKAILDLLLTTVQTLIQDLVPC